MKLHLLLILLFIFNQPQSTNYKLTLNVTGLKPLKGDLYISLHNRPEYFQVADSAFRKMKISVKEETERVVFEDVPEGRYAIALYHDENLNGNMETNDKGFPREGYGFSTKSMVFGRPKFGQAAFEVSGNDTVEVKMIYPSASGTN